MGVLGGGLAEEAQGGVPGGVGAVGHPAPVGVVLQEEPGGAAEGAGEVGGEGVDGDDEVELGDGGGEGEEAFTGRRPRCGGADGWRRPDASRLRPAGSAG